MLELIIRLVASLAVVVGLMLLLARFMGKRYGGRAGAPVQVLHRQPLSRSSSVAVITVIWPHPEPSRGSPPATISSLNRDEASSEGVQA